MSKSKSAKWIGIGLMVGGFMLFAATWLSHSFWRFVSSLGLTGDLAHPILSWLGLVIMAMGLWVLYRQLSPNQYPTGRLVFGVTAVGVLVAMIFTSGLLLNFPDSLGRSLGGISFLLMFIGGWIVIVLSVRGTEGINQPSHR